MRDVLLLLSGCLAVAIAITHGVLGETRVFARARIEPPATKLLIHLVWQAGTVAWIGGGVLLICAGWFFVDPARRATILVLAVVFASAALANAWATRGRHYGWMGMALVVVLALAGL
ncbi:hypothetical protein [Phreatobacter stygius]|uniref:DUF3325 domain-containing protein n=1 Tax=Phreatobacter stygius TaxID=1940610 RepID=A0A4D7AZ51_9HYPH|nr:hypothetical protein [Phreatobacter stygius]QCI66629.1 hypothetical protein E8M01_21780 [Phreatobacter stygius]